MSVRSTTTIGTDATWSPAEGCTDAFAGVQLVDVVSGPRTIVALGEDCLVCEEGLEPGQVYVFCRDATGSGVAHESCADNAGPDHTNRALLR
ncbi:MAG TPA: hypothetical protein VIT42_03570 [Microlunatus sp.]